MECLINVYVVFNKNDESPREILSAYLGREGKKEMLSLHPIRNAIFKYVPSVLLI